MEQNYIGIMIESLQKKLNVLAQIEGKNKEQEVLLQGDSVEWDAFDRSTDEKAELIEEMDRLDEGFEQLYSRVEEKISTPEGKQACKPQIKQMQELIAAITEKSVSIQASEARNKKLVEDQFARSKQKIGQSRNSGRVAMDYYKNMQQTHVVEPAFWDSKK